MQEAHMYADRLSANEALREYVREPGVATKLIGSAIPSPPRIDTGAVDEGGDLIAFAINPPEAVDAGGTP